MDADDDFDVASRTLEQHLTAYATDPNMSEKMRAEARRILALEASLSVVTSAGRVVKVAREIEDFLRGEGSVAALREVTQ